MFKLLNDHVRHVTYMIILKSQGLLLVIWLQKCIKSLGYYHKTVGHIALFIHFSPCYIAMSND